MRRPKQPRRPDPPDPPPVTAVAVEHAVVVKTIHPGGAEVLTPAEAHALAACLLAAAELARAYQEPKRRGRL